MAWSWALSSNRRMTSVGSYDYDDDLDDLHCHVDTYGYGEDGDSAVADTMHAATRDRVSRHHKIKNIQEASDNDSSDENTPLILPGVGGPKRWWKSEAFILIAGEFKQKLDSMGVLECASQ